MKTSFALAGILLSFTTLSPLARAQTGWAVTLDNELIRFDLSAPGTALASNTITGLVEVDGVSADPFGQILDLAQRNGQLYALDANASFYSLNSTTGAATFLSNALAPLGFDAGFAYDPFASRFRFVSDAAENKLIDTAGNVTDGPGLFYGASDVNASSTASFTGLAIHYGLGTGYALNSANNTLAFTADANFAEFFTLGSLGLDITALASIDILPSGELFAALSQDNLTSGLYQIDADTGTATFVGSFGTAITAIAIPEPSTYAAYIGAAALGLALYLRRRRV